MSSHEIPDDDSITSLSTQDQLSQLQTRHKAELLHLRNIFNDAKETYDNNIRDLEFNYEQQRLRDLKVVYSELDEVKAELSFRGHQLLKAREDIRALINLTPPPYSNSNCSRTLEPLPAFGIRLPSSPSDPPPIIYQSFNPVPYSTTIQIIEDNYSLHKEYLHNRVSAADSDLDIVYQYHHLLDATVNLPPIHHDHL